MMGESSFRMLGLPSIKPRTIHPAYQCHPDGGMTLISASRSPRTVKSPVTELLGPLRPLDDVPESLTLARSEA